MPRNVRNFWIEADIDGRESTLKGGPQNKEGGFTLTIYQRDEGCITEGVTIIGRVYSDPLSSQNKIIELEISLDGNEIATIKAKR